MNAIDPSDPKWLEVRDKCDEVLAQLARRAELFSEIDRTLQLMEKRVESLNG